MKKLAALIIILVPIFSYQTVWAETFYVGVGAGQTTYDTGVTNLTGTATLEDEATSSKLLVGMDIGFGLMAEVYYTDLGGVTFTGNAGDTATEKDGTTFTVPFNGFTSESENTGYGFNAVYKVGMGIASIYGKVGMLHWESKSTFSATGLPSSSESVSGDDVVVGAGVEFAFMPMVGLRVEYEKTEIDKDDVTTIGAALVVGF